MYDAAAKRIGYVNFIGREFQSYSSAIIAAPREEEEARELLRLISEISGGFSGPGNPSRAKVSPPIRA
jgi:hypothetical protein